MVGTKFTQKTTTGDKVLEIFRVRRGAVYAREIKDLDKPLSLTGYQAFGRLAFGDLIARGFITIH